MDIECCICQGRAEKIKTIHWCTDCGTIQVRRRSDEKGYFQEVRWPTRMSVDTNKILRRKELSEPNRTKLRTIINNIIRKYNDNTKRLQSRRTEP